MFTVLVAYEVFFSLLLLLLLLLLAGFVARDSCRSGCRLNYYVPPPPDFFPLPTILSLTQVNQRAPKAGFGAVWQF